MCVTDSCAHVVHVEYYFYFFNLIPSKILIITITVSSSEDINGSFSSICLHFGGGAPSILSSLSSSTVLQRRFQLHQYYLHCHLLPQCCNEGSNSINIIFIVIFFHSVATKVPTPFIFHIFLNSQFDDEIVTFLHYISQHGQIDLQY